ncbi:MAG: glycosyltransferase family 87 protein, partial [Chitinophagaceae bacterium]
ALVQYFKDSYNNYKIFKGVFYHTVAGQPLYAQYPEAYFDSNHYGPLFSVLIAPFALMPDIVGMTLWSLANTWLLYKAITMLPLSVTQRTAVLWIAFIELTTAQHSFQVNPSIAAWIIMTFVFVAARRPQLAPLFALLGFFVKIYGLVALVFGAFSKDKWKLLFFLLLWTLILFALPMVLSSPDYIVDAYQDWTKALIRKNGQNAELQPAGNMQNISVIGMITRVFHLPLLPLWTVLLPAAFLMLAPLLRWKLYHDTLFQLYYLAAVLLSIVLFSTGSESPTFIIAVTGAAIFFVVQPAPWRGWTLFLLCFMLLLTCLSPTDIFPRSLRKSIIQPYALKALPCLLIWATIIYSLLTKKFIHVESRQQAGIHHNPAF